MTETATGGESKKRQGFASMDKATLREIASKGGRKAHEMGVAHEWNPDQARAAGQKGGLVSRGGRGREHSADGRRVTPPRTETPVAQTTVQSES